jgi:hypothetical protein
MHYRFWHNPDEPVRAERWEEVSRSAMNEWRLSATSFSTAVILQSARYSHMAWSGSRPWLPFRRAAHFLQSGRSLAR